MYTKEEVEAAKRTRDAIIKLDVFGIDVLRSVYMAGVIVQWAESQDKVDSPSLMCPLCDGVGRRTFPNCTPPIDSICPACEGTGHIKDNTQPTEPIKD